MKPERCLFCHGSLGFNSPTYTVRKAIKPKGYNHRWMDIGEACETCGEAKQTSYEFGEKFVMPKHEDV